MSPHRPAWRLALRTTAPLTAARHSLTDRALTLLALALLGLAVTVTPALAAGPTILAYSPPTGRTDQSPFVRPWVKLSETADAATVGPSSFYLTILGSPSKLPATYEILGPPQNRVTIVPVAPLADGTTYEVTITAGVKDQDGEALTTPWVWTFTTEADPAPDTLVDVSPGDPYYDAILGLYQAHIVDGTPGPSGPEFRAANPIWRQQFAKMIVNALGLPVDETMKPPFTDLGEDSPSSLYPHQYIAVAYQNAITTGITPTSYGPYRNITRAQVVTMGVRALQSLHPALLSTPPVGYTNTWGTGFSPIHGPLARIAEYNGLLDGLGMSAAHPAGDLTGLDPWGDMPRGEVAQFLWNVHVMLGAATP